MSVDTPAVNDTATPATDATSIKLELARLTQIARAALQPDAIPDALKAIQQWVCWRWELPEKEGGRFGKPPVDAKTGKAGKSNDPATWSTFDDAVARFHQDSKIAGIGLALTPDLGITALDLDHVIADGDVDQKASALLKWFGSTYAEISPSGTGYRLFCYGKPQREGHSDPRWLELYIGGRARYMTVTGNAVDGHPAAIAAMQGELDRLHSLYMERAANPSEKASEKAGKTTPPCVCNPSDRLAAALKNQTIAALYGGSTLHFVNAEGKPDRSAAEISLALRLMTFADGDEQTVAGWMDGSKCEKWNQRDKDTDSYRVATVKAAAAKWDGRKFEEPTQRERESTDTVGGDDPWEPDFEADCGIPDPDPQPAKEKPSSPSAWITGDKLLTMKFADPVWLLPDILPESGAFIISGKPKAGKSWFVLQLAMSVVQGGSFLNRDVPDGAVLYLALEDNWRRLQDRMMKLQPDADRHSADFAGLAYRVVAPTVDTGLANELSRVIAGSKKKIRLVILDTLQKVRGNAVATGSQYAMDYDTLGKLKRVADEQGICLVIVHHLRKADSDDVHDGVSGTNGIAGAVDGSLVLVTAMLFQNHLQASVCRFLCCKPL